MTVDWSVRNIIIMCVIAWPLSLWIEHRHDKKKGRK